MVHTHVKSLQDQREDAKHKAIILYPLKYMFRVSNMEMNQTSVCLLMPCQLFIKHGILFRTFLTEIFLCLVCFNKCSYKRIKFQNEKSRLWYVCDIFWSCMLLFFFSLLVFKESWWTVVKTKRWYSYRKADIILRKIFH